MSGAKPRHGRIAGRVFRHVDRFVERKHLGVVYAAETGYIVARDPDTVRCPDVSFVRADRVEGHDENEYFEAPDLAVEVVSPSDTPKKVEQKVALWLRAGARSVWVIDPDTPLVSITRADGTSVQIGPSEALRDESVLPGFSLKPMSKIL